MNLKMNYMKSLTQYFLANTLILIVGLALIGLAVFTINTNAAFFLSLITGFTGIALTFLSTTLLIDLNEIRNLRKR